MYGVALDIFEFSGREPFFHFSRETIIPGVISSSEKMNSHSFYLLVSLTLTANK